MRRRFDLDSKHLLTHAIWGNLFGFLCSYYIISSKYAFERFSIHDFFEVVLSVLILGFIGGYYTAKETSGENKGNTLYRFIENTWFSAMLSLVFGFPGIAFGFILR